MLAERYQQGVNRATSIFLLLILKKKFQHQNSIYILPTIFKVTSIYTSNYYLDIIRTLLYNFKLQKRKPKGFVGARQRTRKVKRFFEEHSHLPEDELCDEIFEPNDIVGDRTLRVAEVENILAVDVSIDDVLSNADFHERMDDGVENDDVFYFCEAPDVHKNFVDDVDDEADCDVDSDIDNELSAIDRQD
ncbi:Uncharacterized protein APZ42_024718 [Daphnia magna]|uniref:Uncharacterized protein n=1 Tax=Daphnia magna TaxID=35525 RepID=A0A162DEL6_9CRUS|nr:Uncharacterized protein APZ42_024718 [Daphnia magna]